MKNIILLIQCPDKEGLVHTITGFIAQNNGNVLELEQFVDQNEDLFFMRVVWDASSFKIDLEEFDEAFQKTAREIGATCSIYDASKLDSVAIMVSSELHCMAELLIQRSLGNLQLNIPVIISNSHAGEELAEKFDINFVHTQTKEVEKKIFEKQQLEVLAKHKVDFIGLARYMQILSGDFISSFKDRIINIHHSFLPAFAGANPYRQAYQRGVKVIGATSHLVTEELDQGPIISQDTQDVHHGHSVKALKKIGQEIEKKVFILAIQKQLERKIIRVGNRTIIFD